MGWLSHAFVLLYLGCYDFLVLLDKWNYYSATILIPHRPFLLVAQDHFNVVNSILRIERSLHVHENVFVINLLQLPFSWLIWLKNLLLLRGRNLFASFFSIFTSTSWLWNIRLNFSIGISLSSFPKFPKLFLKIGLIQIPSNFFIPLSSINIAGVRNLDLYVSDIRNLNPPTLNPDHSTPQQLFKDFIIFNLIGIVYQLSMIL